jgi:hypothetical protein
LEWLSDGLVANGVDNVERNEVVGQEAKAPLAVALRGLAAGQTDELGFLLAVELRFVLSLRSFSPNAAFKAAFSVAPPDPCYSAGGELQRLRNLVIAPLQPFWPFVGFEQHASPGLLSNWSRVPTDKLGDPLSV